MKNIRLTIWKDRETMEVSTTAFTTKEKAIEKAQERIKEHCEDYGIDCKQKAQKDSNGDDLIIDLNNGYMRDGRHEKEIDVFSTTLYSN